jgi:Streptomyces sporulation and cell division protein, SsgA
LPDDVRVEVVVEDEAPSRRHTTVLQLGWRRNDPLAVTLIVTAQPDHPALPHGSWVVLRDFLRYGLDEPTGDGDVRITPLAGRVRLDLARGGRSCGVTVDPATLREFLDATDAVVPAGEERNEEALDALIQRLLDS